MYAPRPFVLFPIDAALRMARASNARIRIPAAFLR
jgi:hypothetical protein